MTTTADLSDLARKTGMLLIRVYTGSGEYDVVRTFDQKITMRFSGVDCEVLEDYSHFRKDK